MITKKMKQVIKPTCKKLGFMPTSCICDEFKNCCKSGKCALGNLCCEEECKDCCPKENDLNLARVPYSVPLPSQIGKECLMRQKTWY